MQVTSLAKLLRHDASPQVFFTKGFAMFRAALPAMICVLATQGTAQTLSLPGLSPEKGPAACDNIPFSQDNCVRVLACIGDAGVYFDGQARGWDAGPVTGVMSTGVTCSGEWRSDGPAGTGLSSLACSDQSRADVVYYSQDNETGTVIGQGLDSRGRYIRVWSGTNVLDFLTEDGETALPCVQGDIPIS
jgi:hypothetical protein